MAIDSARNVVEVEQAGEFCIARMASDPRHGYIAHAGEFGNDDCPDGPAVCTWFGPGERYPDWQTALAAVTAAGTTF